MKKLGSRRPYLEHGHNKSFMKRYRSSVIVIAVAIVATAGSIYWMAASTQAKVDQANKTSAANTKAADALIAQTKAKKAAELKAKQEAEGKIAAEQAQTATDDTAKTFDSSTCNTSKTHNDPTSIAVVVNKKHCMQPVTFEPNDLVSIGNGFMLSSKAAPSYQAMLAAATAAGQSFYVTSSYRSYSDQVTTYAYWVNQDGYDGADTYSARPGYSEHQTGLAFDVAANGCVLNCFGTTSQYSWLQAHAADYGFIQRYYAGEESITGYEAEEWHYRYVGIDVAKDMRAKGIKTLEQYWNITGGDYYK